MGVQSFWGAFGSFGEDNSGAFESLRHRKNPGTAFTVVEALETTVLLLFSILIFIFFQISVCH